jgi:DICT domain-containing protein
VIGTPGWGTVPFLTSPSPRPGTPYDIITESRPTAETTKAVLLPTTRYLESQAEGSVVLATFQNGRFLDKARYARFAETSPFVAVLATDLPSEPAAGVRGTALTKDEPLTGEWDVIVVGPHFAGALVARDLGDDGPDGNRRFRYALTHDRDLVLDAARALLSWIVPT